MKPEKIPYGELPKTSQPAMQAFLLVGLTKLKDFTKITEKELKKLHGVGPKAIRIIKAELKSKGLDFKKSLSKI